MISRRSALMYAGLAMMPLASASRAGVWGLEPAIGVAADHSTNPALLQADYSEETHEALLIDSPASYIGDAVKFSVLPSFRISDSPGYSSLASNYSRLTARGEIDDERGILSASAGISRDSSLYHDYIFNGSLGVRRDTATADTNWDRQLTERAQFDVDVNAQRVRYGQSSGVASFTDYSYSSIAPTLSWQRSEKTKLTISAGVGLYNSSDGTTRSVNTNVEVGFVRQLTELWTLTANAGVSRESDRFQTFFGPFEVSTNGTVFKTTLARQAALLYMSATASRQLTPSGLAFLSRQNSYDLQVGYPVSERWAFTANARRVKSEDPQILGPALDRRYSVASLTTIWHWTEKWTVTASASYITTTYGPVASHVAAKGISLELSRQFDRITLP